MTVDAGTITLGLILIVVAGILNGSWNASFSPKVNLAINETEPAKEKKTSDDESSESTPPLNDLTYHHAFALFQLYAAIINIPLCIFWAGGFARVTAILDQTPAHSIVLIIVFSIAWGAGTLLFGKSCKIAGVGLGTNLSIGIVSILGTLLPLITERTLISSAGAVICSGVVICCVGLAISTKALAARDVDERKIIRKKQLRYMISMVESTGETDISAYKVVKEQFNNNFVKEQFNDDENISYAKSNVSYAKSKLSYHKSLSLATPQRMEGDESIIIDGCVSESDNEMFGKDGDISTTTNADTLDSCKISSVLPPVIEVNRVNYATWKKIGICIATGILSVQLQFAFIFGDTITDLALGNDVADPPLPGSTHESGGAAIIWLLAISLGAPVAIVNGIFSSPVPLSSAIRTPLSRHIKVICTTSLPWLCHIHIYGVCATTLLPKKVAASIGWPMLMMVTTGQALILSVYLGEWKEASKMTIYKLKWSLGVMGFGLIILMCSAAVPTS